MNTSTYITERYREIWQSTSWYQALTLTERLHTPQTTIATHGPGERAVQRLQLWKEQSPLERSEISFTERLAMDGLTEDSLLALLDEPMERLQQRLSDTIPEWLQTIIAAFEADIHQQIITGEKAQEKHSLLHAIEPLLKHGRAHFATGIQELAQQLDFLPFQSDTILDLLFPSLVTHVTAKLVRTMVLEMHVARLQGRLQGDTPEERFEDFLRQLSQPDAILALFQEYPVLARQLVTTIELWVTTSLEFLQRLCHDWNEICTLFAPGNDPGVLTAIQGDKGDLHRGGHSVIQLTFSSGFQLIYKPKSLATDAHFQELLGWLNGRGHTPELRTLKLLNKGNYGWSEYVSPCDCATTEAVGRFYERQGSYLALLYALKATDMHAENVIAHGEHPFLIDLEALFHSSPYNEKSSSPDLALQQVINQSVLRIGLLPQRIRTAENFAGIDVSGLGGQQGQLSLHLAPVWKEASTDQMRIAREHVNMLHGENQPKIKDSEVHLLDYLDHLTAGFTTTYRMLMSHREEFLNQVVSLFSHDETRLILRPTAFYSKLLAESFHPNLLRDALERERIFDRLWLHAEQQTYLKRIIRAERADLLNGDTPLFTSSPTSRDIFSSCGERIADFYTEPAMESVKKRILGLDEHDLNRQVWAIRATCATTLKNRHPSTVQTLQLKPSKMQVSRQRLLEAACAIGDHLGELALSYESYLNWLTLVPVQDHEWDLAFADGNLYNGVPGTVLFLSYLGALTGKKQYTLLAKAALPTLKCQLEPLQKKQDKVDIGTDIGAFEGLAGSIYLYSHLSKLWNDSSFSLEAEDIVECIRSQVKKDRHFDIIAGTAGCILSLLSLYAVKPSARTLAVACECGKHLLEHAIPMEKGIGWRTLEETPPLAGFSHGAAGIAFSLFRLAEVSGETAFHQAALDAIAYERSIFSPQRQNWPDLRTSIQSQQHEGGYDTFMTAWCHGAPGIGLGRLGSLSFIDDIVIRAEIDTALKCTLATGFGWNHSLCHGDFGNLETLLTATQLSGTISYHQDLERITAMLLDSIEKDGWVTNTPLSLVTPGLMTGLAGIGYQLLRLAAPECVPSVLLLAPPHTER